MHNLRDFGVFVIFVFGLAFFHASMEEGSGSLEKIVTGILAGICLAIFFDYVTGDKHVW